MAGGAYAYCVCGGALTRAPGPRRLALSRRPRANATWRTRRQARAELPGASDPDGADDDAGEPREPMEMFRAGEAAGVVSGRTAELPLFPLQVVLNPGGAIPLYIFELRYRLMFNRIHDGDSRFGVVLYDKEAESLARVGCCAELLRFEPLPDGRIMTNNKGVERFRILRILEDDPYTVAEVEFFEDEPPAAECPDLEGEVWTALQDVLRLSNRLYDKTLDLAPDIKRLAPGTGGLDGDAKRMQEFSFAVSQVLDMPLREQQLLLQMSDTEKRLRRQSKMLGTARQYLAAQVTIKNAGLPEW